MGVTPSWPKEAISRVKGRVHARQKLLEGYDDRHEIHPLHDDICVCMSGGSSEGSELLLDDLLCCLTDILVDVPVV